MNFIQYIEYAKRTESISENIKISFIECPRTFHAYLGLTTEAGELFDALKKFIFYGKPLDTINILEELGDYLWYVAILSDVIVQENELTDLLIDSLVQVDFADGGFIVAKSKEEIHSDVFEAIRLLGDYAYEVYQGDDLDISLIRQMITTVKRLLKYFGFSLEECLTRNIEKLKIRYPNGFDDLDAINRNLAAERSTLENSGGT